MLESVFICIYSEQPPPRCCCRPSGMGGLGGGGCSSLPSVVARGGGGGFDIQTLLCIPAPWRWGHTVPPPSHPPSPPRSLFGGRGPRWRRGCSSAPPSLQGWAVPCFLLRFFGPGATGAVGPPPSALPPTPYCTWPPSFCTGIKEQRGHSRWLRARGGRVAAGVWGGGLFQGVPNGKGTTWSLPVVA